MMDSGDTSHHRHDVPASKKGPPSSSVISLEEYLSVPLEILFRNTSSGSQSRRRRRRRPKKKAWSKAEVLLLTQVQLWAAEMDCLIDHVLLPTLENKRWAEQFARQDCLPYVTLRSVGVLALTLMCDKVPSQVLTYVETEMDRILAQLQQAAALLTHYAEQNCNLADSLWDALQLEDDDEDDDEGERNELQETQEKQPSSLASSTSSPAGHYLVEEKRILAQILEQVASRIQHLLQHATSDAAGGSLFQLDGCAFTPMSDFCEQLFGKLDEASSSSASPAKSAIDSVSTVTTTGDSSSNKDLPMSTQSPSTVTAAAATSSSSRSRRTTPPFSPQRRADAVAAMMHMANTTTSEKAVAPSPHEKKKKRRITAADDPAIDDDGDDEEPDEGVARHRENGEASQTPSGGSQVTPEHGQYGHAVEDDNEEARHLFRYSKDSGRHSSQDRYRRQQKKGPKLPPAGFTQPISTSHNDDDDEDIPEDDDSQKADTQSAVAALKGMGRRTY